jgi:spore maturation protein CgeB
VSNYREHSKEIFGDAVPMTETTQDMENVIRYYLEHEDERKAIAASLPALVAGRTFAEMADVVLSDCSEVLS